MTISIVSLRVDGPSGPLVDGLSFSSEATRLLFVGMPRELGEAIAGLKCATSGSVFFSGRSGNDLFRNGLLRYVALDAPLPESWSVWTYLTWSRRLSNNDSQPSVREGLLRFHLGALERVAIQALTTPERRALCLAAAFVTGARIFVIEDPTARWLIPTSTPKVGLFAPKPRAETPFSSEAEERLTKLVDEGFAGAQILVLSTNDESPLLSRGFVGHRFASGLLGGLSRDAGAPIGYLVSLAKNPEAFMGRFGAAAERRDLHSVLVSSPLDVNDLFRHAAEAGSLISEIRPIYRAGGTT